MNQLPKLNSYYWFLMLLCTTMGELIGNLLSRNFQLGYTFGAMCDVAVFSVIIFAVLFLKLKNEAFYWALILMGNIGGTNLADWVTLDPLENDKKWGFLQPLQLGTKGGSLVVMASLCVVVFLWKWFDKKKSNHAVSETLYWVAILLSSTFGTTSGDFITNDTPLGAFGGSIFLLGTLVVVYFLFKRKIVSQILAYWLALVLMHPVGATIGNYISKPIGLNLGNVYTNIGLILTFIAIYGVKLRVEKRH